MRIIRLLPPYFISISLVLAIVWAGPVRGQEDVPAAEPAAAASDQDGPENDADEGPPFREQTIYVPYEKLREVFEKEGRGVFLPYEKFQKLWEAARQRTVPAEQQGPPVGAVIAEAESEATVDEEVVSVAARLKIEILAEGWHEVPLRLADAAIRTATLDGQPARIVAGPEGYKLLVKNDGKQAMTAELRLDYVKAFTKSPGQNSVSFQAPQAPVNRWKIRIPESGVKVNIHPLIAATEMPAAEAGADDLPPGDADDAAADADADAPPAQPQAETVVLAFVGAAPSVRIDWTPKAEGATGLAALATVQAEQEVRIDEGVMRTRAQLVYEISRAELSRLSIEVPAGQDVVGVFDPNVRQWDVKKENDTQTIDVQLFEPTQGRQQVTVELEHVSNNLLAADLVAPIVKALDVGRQQGVLVVGLAPGLQAEAVRRSGLVQMDRSELPSRLKNQEWAFAYRYAALPFDLALKAEKVQPKIRTQELVEAYVEPEQISLSLLALYTIERAGIFQLQLHVPADFEVQQVRGYETGDVKAAAVDPQYLYDAQNMRLTVNLTQEAIDRVGLLVEFTKRLDDPNLLRHTGEQSEIKLDLPRVDPASIERCTGRLVVYKPDSLRVVPLPSAQQGISDAISLGEVYRELPSAREGRFPATRPALSFAYTEQPVDLTLAVERRKPYVTARQLLTAHIEAGVVKYQSTFFFDILYSGIQALRIDLPADLAPDVSKPSDAIQEEEFDPTTTGAPAPADGYVAWRFTGETELIGPVKIELVWQRKLPGELEVGTPREVPLPQLKPIGVDRAWGQIVIAKAETIDVGAIGQPEGLEMIDPQQNLMEGAEVTDAALAFEFHGDWKLDIQATRYELSEVKRTSIERAVVRTAATLDGELIVQALYRLRSARQRLAVQLPDVKNVSFDRQPLWINGEPVALEKGDGDNYFVPLVGQDPDEPLLVELRYSVPGNPSQLDFPVFPDEPPVAVQKVFLCVYLPERLALLGSRGPWADEMSWQWRGPFKAVPVADCAEVTAVRMQAGSGMQWDLPDDEALVRWVMQGVSVTGNPFEGLPAEGTLHVYSTLRPAEPPAGSLRLTTLNRNWLSLLVFAAIAVVGLLMITRPVREKFAVIVAVAIALILCGVFLPTFAVQILGLPFTVAVILLLLLWLAALVLWQTQPGRSLLGAVVSGRQPDNVVVRPVTPPPPPSSASDEGPPVSASEPAEQPAQDADAPTDEAGDDAQAKQETEGDKPEDEPDAGPTGDAEKPKDKPPGDTASDENGSQPEGGRTDA